MAERDKFSQRVTRDRQTKKNPRKYPFVVAFDTTDGTAEGDELTLDEFYDVLDDYDSVIVRWKEGDHPSQEEHFLLYGEAKEIDLTGEDVERARDTGRKRSKEVVGDFDWFDHGEGLVVNMSIGLHCRNTEVWEELP